MDDNINAGMNAFLCRASTWLPPAMVMAPNPCIARYRKHAGIELLMPP